MSILWPAFAGTLSDAPVSLPASQVLLIVFGTMHESMICIRFVHAAVVVMSTGGSAGCGKASAGASSIVGVGVGCGGALSVRSVSLLQFWAFALESVGFRCWERLQHWHQQ